MRKYYRYGQTLVVYTHGDKEKRDKLPLIAATERPTEWGAVTYIEIHCGHRHMEETSEHNQVKVRTIPSLSRNDAWHTSMGYNGMKSGMGFLYHKDDGLSTILYHNSKNVE